MSGRNRKGIIYNLFKDTFDISVFHKPSMKDDDVSYIIILEKSVFIKLKLDDNIIVIRDLYQLTKASYKRYEDILEVFINQSTFTVLVDILGHTGDIDTTCLKLDVPVVEDLKLLSVAQNVYDKLKSYYAGDASKYGFYLLAVADTNEKVSEPIEEVQPEPEIIDTVRDDTMDVVGGFLDYVNTIESMYVKNATDSYRIFDKRMTGNLFFVYTKTDGIEVLHCHYMEFTANDTITFMSTVESYCNGYGKTILVEATTRGTLSDYCYALGWNNVSSYISGNNLFEITPR